MDGARCNVQRFPKSCQQGDKTYHKPSGDDFADVSMTGSGIAASTQREQSAHILVGIVHLNHVGKPMLSLAFKVAFGTILLNVHILASISDEENKRFDVQLAMGFASECARLMRRTL